MKRFIAFAFLLSQVLLVNAQQKDSLACTHYFSISTDIAQYTMVQPNISIEYRMNKRAFGINLGWVIPASSSSVNPFANGQYKWPGLVYNGQALRVYYKNYYSRKKPNRYICLQLLAKSLWYNYASFTDMPKGDESQVSYSMKETATVWGLDILFHTYPF